MVSSNQLSEVLNHLADIFDLLVQAEDRKGEAEEVRFLHTECRHWGWVASALLAAGVKDPRHAYN